MTVLGHARGEPRPLRRRVRERLRADVGSAGRDEQPGSAGGCVEFGRVHDQSGQRDRRFGRCVERGREGDVVGGEAGAVREGERMSRPPLRRASQTAPRRRAARSRARAARRCAARRRRCPTRPSRPATPPAAIARHETATPCAGVRRAGRGRRHPPRAHRGASSGCLSRSARPAARAPRCPCGGAPSVRAFAPSTRPGRASGRPSALEGLRGDRRPRSRRRRAACRGCRGSWWPAAASGCRRQASARRPPSAGATTVRPSSAARPATVPRRLAKLSAPASNGMSARV